MSSLLITFDGIRKIAEIEMKGQDWDSRCTLMQQLSPLFEMVDLLLNHLKKQVVVQFVMRILEQAATQKDVKEFIDCGGNINNKKERYLQLAQRWCSPLVPTLLAYGADPRLFNRYTCEDDPLAQKMAALIEQRKLTFKDARDIKQEKLDAERKRLAAEKYQLILANAAMNKENRKARRAAARHKDALLQLPQVESAAAPKSLAKEESYAKMKLEQKKQEETEKAARIARHEKSEKDRAAQLLHKQDSKNAKKDSNANGDGSGAAAAAETQSSKLKGNCFEFAIEYDKDALKAIEKDEVPVERADQLTNELSKLIRGEESPVKLKNQELFKIKMGQGYRALYTIDWQNQKIVVTAIGPRENFYKKQL